MSRKRNRIPFGKPFIAGKELHYIAEAVTTGHLSGGGRFTERCHKWLEKELGCARAFLTHSCTGALEMAAILCDIKPGDEVILPSFTYVSTANAFVLQGAVPVFVDIRADTLNIDEGLINQAITKRTKAIVPVHYAGVACAMDEIMQIAETKRLLVVEDAAQALFSKYKDRFLGAIGHVSCLSFHETKNIISGEGGALLVNDKRFIERSEIIWQKGTNRNQFSRGEIDRYSWVDIGSSFLPSELTGAFLYGQLEQTQAIITLRRRICQRYHRLLSPLEEKGLIEISNVKNDRTSGHLFYLLTRSETERARLIKHLTKNNIVAVFHYVPLHSSPAGIKYGRASGDMSVTNRVSERLLRLPLYYEMSDQDVDRVVEVVTQFYL